MGTLIAGYATSHTAMMIRKYDPRDPAQVRIRECFVRVRAAIERVRPDVLVVVSSEHLNSFFYDNYPQICVGLGSRCIGWGDAGVPSVEIPLATDFAAQLLRVGVESGFDLSWSVDPRLDHAFMAPLSLLLPKRHIPIVPIFQNASTEPLPPYRRCAELGVLIRSVVEQRPSSERVLLLATGGLSHWVGTPEMGKINVDFDKRFLACIERGDLDSIVTMSVPEVTAEAGNGAQEIRNWVTVMAANPRPATVLAYEPIEQWATGMALSQFF